MGSLMNKSKKVQGEIVVNQVGREGGGGTDRKGGRKGRNSKRKEKREKKEEVLTITKLQRERKKLRERIHMHVKQLTWTLSDSESATWISFCC